MKQRLPVIIAAISGLIMLAAFFFQPFTAPYLGLVLNWAIIVSSVALLVAIANLFVTHIRFILKGRRGFLYSIILVLTFLATLILGWHLAWTILRILKGFKQFWCRLKTRLWR
ncbi:MAG: hypothetical protein RBS09_03650 [Anaerolineaceae bacterium]|jgi:hypothetical protein|nr:hypothetical protein [Anaerolineaceae bacterium]